MDEKQENALIAMLTDGQRADYKKDLDIEEWLEGILSAYFEDNDYVDSHDVALLLLVAFKEREKRQEYERLFNEIANGVTRVMNSMGGLTNHLNLLFERHSVPKGPACGHSACRQNFIDTGSVFCISEEPVHLAKPSFGKIYAFDPKRLADILVERGYTRENAQEIIQRVRSDMFDAWPALRTFGRGLEMAALANEFEQYNRYVKTKLQDPITEKLEKSIERLRKLIPE